MRLISAWFRIPFWQRVLAGFVLGGLAGWLMGPAAETWFGPLGDLYVTLIKMIAVPLVFFAVINAVASLHGQKSMAALGGRTFLWFTQEQWKSILPVEPKVGLKYAVPEAVGDRMVRLTLLNTIY